MRIRGWLVTMLGVLLMFGIVLGMRLVQRHDRISEAENLFRAGSYEAARAIYLELEDEESAALCEQMSLRQRYGEAVSLLDAGEYERARAQFLDLGDYEDSAILAQECVFCEAGALAEGGEPEKARELYLSLGDYPGSREAVASLTGALYDRALVLAGRGEYENACALWRDLGDYRDSARLLERGERAVAQRRENFRVALNNPQRRFDNSYYYDTFLTDEAYILFPAEPNEDTRFFLYICGGRNEEINADFLYCYLDNPAPNTLSVVLRRNDAPDMDRCCEKGLRILDEAAADCGLFVRELVVAGSSLGAYPALQCPRVAAPLGIRVTCVLSLDAGNRWNESDMVPSFEQCRALAQTGAHFYLFQPTWLDTGCEPVRLLVNTGNWVMLAGCLREDHEQITYDAMNLGVFDWALGDRTGPCPGEIYSFRRLKPA